MGYEVNNFTDEIKEQLKEHNTKIKTEDLKFVETNIDNDMFEEDDNVYSKRASMLNIETKEEFRKFTPVLENDYKFNQYLKFEKLCATEEEIKTRLNNKLTKMLFKTRRNVKSQLKMVLEHINIITKLIISNII